MKNAKENIIKILKNPGQAVVLLWRRVFPFGIVPKDQEAYRIGSWSYGDLKRVPLTEAFKGIETVEISIKNAFDKDFYASMDLQEVFILCSIAKFVHAKKIIEVGTFDGNTTLNLAINSPADAHITTIDLPPDWKGDYEIKIPELYKNVTDRDTVGRQYKEHKECLPKITQVFGDSAKINWEEIGAPFDFVFIDGCHHYEYVLKDTQNALKHTVPGGIIVWHDYGMVKDVSQVVDQTAKSMNIYSIRGTRLAVGLVKK